MTTITAGTTASFQLGPFDTITISAGSARGSIALTSSTPKLVADQTLSVASGTFGPWGAPMSAVMSVTQGSADYVVTSRSATVDQNSAMQTLVSTPGKFLGGRRVARIFFGRMGTLDNSTQKTFHIAAEMAQHFDAISPVFVNTSATISPYFQAKLSVAGAWGDGNNSAGTWTTVTNDGNDTAWPLKVAGPGGQRTSYTVAKPIALRSVARSDGGTFPLIFCRAYCVDPNAALPAYGNGGTDVLTGWATRTTGRRWAARQQNGDAITTPSNFTSTTDVSQSPVVGFVYWSRGAVVGISTCADSAGNGQNNSPDVLLTGEGWAVPLANQLASFSGIPVEYSNFSVAGEESVNLSTGTGFYQRALDMLRDDMIRPDLLMVPSGSFNPIGGSLTAAIVDKQATILRSVLDEAAKANVRALVYTWMPVTTTANAYGATDALRVAHNAETLALFPSTGTGWNAQRAIGAADFSTAISGATVGGMVQIAAGLTIDNVHANDAGNALLTAAALPVAKTLLFGSV